MAKYSRNIFRPSRIAGGLLLWSSVVGYLTAGRVSPVAFLLGLGLCLTQETAKLDVLRFVVFVWCGLSLLLAVFAGVSAGVWIPTVRAILLGGAMLGLMLDGLSEPMVAVLAVVGFGAAFM